MIPMWVSKKERKRRGRVGGSCRACGGRYDENGNCLTCVRLALGKVEKKLFDSLTENMTEKQLKDFKKCGKNRNLTKEEIMLYKRRDILHYKSMFPKLNDPWYSE